MILVSAQAFPPKPGGIQYLLAGTAEHIAKAGHEVKVLADGGTNARQWDRTSGACYSVERFSGLRFLRRRFKAKRITELSRSENIKALYADSWKSLEYLPNNYSFPVIVWAHGNEYPDDLAKERRIRTSLEKADHILFNSQGTKDRAAKFLPTNKSFSIINPPLNEPDLASFDDEEATKAIWGQSDKRLFSLCRLIDWKGVDTAIRALPEILKIYPNTLYVVAGVGDDQSRLENLAREHAVDHAVKFIGWVEGGLKVALLGSADLYVQPGRQVDSEREGYGISYAEAALHGLPSISGNAGGAPEAVIDGQSGLVVDGTDKGEVVEAILSLLSDEKKLRTMRQAARQHGKTCLWQNQINRVLDAAGITNADMNG